MGTRPDLVIMLLAGGVTGPLTGMVVGRLACGMIGSRVDTLTEACMTAVVADLSTLEAVLYAMDVWAAKVCETAASTVVRFDVMVEILIGVPDIGGSAEVSGNMWVTVMAVLEFITLRVSLEELLLLCWAAFRCWPIAAILICRASQACMPSYHVC